MAIIYPFALQLMSTRINLYIFTILTLGTRYVDGQGYMSDVADAILAAKDEIFITDWQ